MRGREIRCAGETKTKTHETQKTKRHVDIATPKGIGANEGFRTQGGENTCTEGIWIWSVPFVRTVGGERVAYLLMDTQGAWDGDLTNEQSATIFGLSCVLSSRPVTHHSLVFEVVIFAVFVLLVLFMSLRLRVPGLPFSVGLRVVSVCVLPVLFSSRSHVPAFFRFIA